VIGGEHEKLIGIEKIDEPHLDGVAQTQKIVKRDQRVTPKPTPYGVFGFSYQDRKPIHYAFRHPVNA
jgi:hypothetical protein